MYCVIVIHVPIIIQNEFTMVGMLYPIYDTLLCMLHAHQAKDSMDSSITIRACSAFSTAISPFLSAVILPFKQVRSSRNYRNGVPKLVTIVMYRFAGLYLLESSSLPFILA